MVGGDKHFDQWNTQDLGQEYEPLHYEGWVILFRVLTWKEIMINRLKKLWKLFKKVWSCWPVLLIWIVYPIGYLHILPNKPKIHLYSSSILIIFLNLFSQYCGEPPWPRSSVLGLRPPGFEFRILCLEDSVISIISPSSGWPSLAKMCTKVA